MMRKQTVGERYASLIESRAESSKAINRSAWWGCPEALVRITAFKVPTPQYNMHTY